MCRRGGRKRAIGTRALIVVPRGPNERWCWSLDFVSDQFTDGRRFRILAIVDDCTRENLALVADISLSGLRGAREIDRVIAERGMPKMIVSDTGSEFTSNAILAWLALLWPVTPANLLRRYFSQIQYPECDGQVRVRK